MAMEDIISKIKENADAEIEKANSDADSKIQQINDDKSKAISDYQSQIDAKLKIELQQIKSQSDSKANTDSRSIYNKALEEKLDEGFKIIKDNFDEFCKTDTYKEVLGAIVKDALKELGAGATITVNPRDKDLLKVPKTCKVKTDESVSGGIRAVSKDGSMGMDETLDDILDSAKDSVAIEFLKLIK
ncbi:A-type Na(+),H(+)-transporting-ATP synthase subunit E [Candidatus Mancarchaeum acidiphilum]|uniref:A-type Na(+),H(+)-transporting-ATP synthase subunit E n=1 Tax=Candidatus Mancarchaeum acidiphilum TaxID=1920749 RepID=A0A218NMH9_9ARCH|nr:V-type ATP synthase subunit E [Candidatus Mancarchaeum acidiphilum]ASI13678.1 A-type Na(+),H(+)-transporting-ATP synthase subunit E [Candidatus Mancarchaeum acidiphilum]